MDSPFSSPFLFMVLVLICSSVYHCNASTQGECLQSWHKGKLSSRPIDLLHPTNLSMEAKVPIFNKDSDLLTETWAAANSSRQANFLPHGFPEQPHGRFRFSQYSGYVPIHADGTKQLFYYFVEASVKCVNAPLILWLNGGPGCSSFGYGAMTEVGPWRVRSDGRTLYYNKYSWNRLVNVLFVDSPAGVGFSYSNIPNAPFVVGDTPTTEDSYTFLVNWFQRFPEYQNRKFYIAGESYAGLFVPELANKILTQQANGEAKYMNLQGVMVGNALMNEDTDKEGMYTYPWTHGLISDATHKGLIANCVTNVTSSCEGFVNAIAKDRGNININNIYAPVCHEKGPKANVPYAIPGYDPCIENYVKHYLNVPQVQHALHAKPTIFSLCNLDLNSKWNWTDSPESVLSLFSTMIGKNVKILVYSGDVDSNVPITSTKMALEILNLPVKEEWTSWTSDDEVGGYKVVYEGLTFASIRGAGHEAPLYQPSRMFALLDSFLKSS